MPTQEIHRVPDAIIQAIRAYGGCRLARSNDMADQHYANAIELIGSALAAVPTQAIPQGEREAFETQFAYPRGWRNFTRDEADCYVASMGVLEGQWKAWLAGRASLAAPAQAPADLSEAIYDRDRFKADYEGACRTVAEMHAAATGEPGCGPRRGVVEDVADLKAESDRLRGVIADMADAMRTKAVNNEWIKSSTLDALASELHAALDPMRDPKRPTYFIGEAPAHDPRDDLARVTAAYDQGFAEGIAERHSPNPYPLMSVVWQAWDAGFAMGLKRAPRAPANPWRDAVIEALTVNCIRKPEHEDDPVRALADLVKWERDEAAGSAPLPPVPGLTDDQLWEMWQTPHQGPVEFARTAIASALSLPKPEPSRMLVQDRTVYVLNERGENRWSATVQPGRDDAGKRTSDDECRVVALSLARAEPQESVDARPDDLPPLPRELGVIEVSCDDLPNTVNVVNAYTADQMRDYACAAIELHAAPSETLVGANTRALALEEAASRCDVIAAHGLDTWTPKGIVAYCADAIRALAAAPSPQGEAPTSEP